MRRTVDQYLLAMLAILYGGGSLCGPALHSIAGPEHSDSKQPLGEDGGGGPASNHDDYPVCHFVVQGQIAGSPALGLYFEAGRPLIADEIPPNHSPAFDRPSRPRGPPIA